MLASVSRERDRSGDHNLPGVMAGASAVAVDFGGGPGAFGMLPTGIASFQLFFDVTTAA